MESGYWQIDSKKEQIKLVWRLSLPAIMAQITSIVMQFIDAAMVGNLGAGQAASIGLVASSTWLLGGLCSSFGAGFSVQVAHAIGAGEKEKAARIVKCALLYGALFALLLAGIGVLISGELPTWLGGEAGIARDAGHYFMIYAAFIPIVEMNYLASSLLQCSGNMKAPGILNSCMCVLDVIFNAFFIFQSSQLQLGKITLTIPGFGLGVAGAALGTALAETVIAVIMLYILLRRTSFMREQNAPLTGCLAILKKSVKISLPMAIEHTALCGAMVAATRIVAPLGTVALAANSFAVTAESFCYMPGYGISSAATTLVGQCFGAGEKKAAKRFAWLTVLQGIFFMSVTAVLMYFLAPTFFQILTLDQAVSELGVKILRIEVLAEPFYAASIVASGALRGAGDTFIPSIMNLFSIWGVRITLSILLVGSYGLVGVWIAMCAELCFRGTIFLIRMAGGRWLRAFN